MHILHNFTASFIARGCRFDCPPARTRPTVSTAAPWAPPSCRPGPARASRRVDRIQWMFVQHVMSLLLCNIFCCTHTRISQLPSFGSWSTLQLQNITELLMSWRPLSIIAGPSICPRRWIYPWQWQWRVFITHNIITADDVSVFS